MGGVADERGASIMRGLCMLRMLMGRGTVSLMMMLLLMEVSRILLTARLEAFVNMGFF